MSVDYFQQVGWREDALKMVFLVTDQTFHVAGDGKVRHTYQECIMRRRESVQLCIVVYNGCCTSLRPFIAWCM